MLQMITIKGMITLHNKEMTSYLKSVIVNASHPVIPFKEDNFVSISFEELLLDEFNVDETNPICILLRSGEHKKLFEALSKEDEKKVQTVQIKCIVSYKTFKNGIFCAATIEKSYSGFDRYLLFSF